MQELPTVAWKRRECKYKRDVTPMQGCRGSASVLHEGFLYVNGGAAEGVDDWCLKTYRLDVKTYEWTVFWSTPSFLLTVKPSARWSGYTTQPLTGNAQILTHGKGLENWSDSQRQQPLVLLSNIFQTLILIHMYNCKYHHLMLWLNIDQGCVQAMISRGLLGII